MVTGVSQPVVEGIETLSEGAVATRVMPNVLDERVFQPFGEEQRQTDLLLFVGVVRHVKGFDVLVQALPDLLRDRPRLRVELIGDAFYPLYRRDLQDALTLAQRLGVRDAIHLAGSAPPLSVAAAMRRASVVVVPSRRESFSSVTMEAIACGTPVVVTRCGGPEDIVESGQGLVVEPENPAKLGRAIRTILDQADEVNPSAMHEAMARRFGRAAAAARLRTLYLEALGRT
jgi:glycosyltransferase involved in cell wall biosynthesis